MRDDPGAISKFRIVSIAGTRPEAIKLAPVLRAIQRHGRFEQRLILTGQHRDLAGDFDFLPRESVRALAVDTTEQSAGELCEAFHHALCRTLDRTEHDLVLVQGDTSSAYAGALAARDRGITLGHVEAGLRSFDLGQPWPEEGYRTAIDTLSDLLFAPTPAAMRNLQAEPEVRGAALLTGNTGIDALLDAVASLQPKLPLGASRRRILVTCHRRENRGEPMLRVADACGRIVRELPVEIAWLLHPSPVVREQMRPHLNAQAHFRLVEPLEYRQMVAAMSEAWLILTDSGGIQEEAPALGRPVLILRDVTERREAVSCRSADLVGTDPDRIVAAVSRLLADPSRYAQMSRPRRPFGDGRASERIVRAIDAFLSRPPSARRLAAALPAPSLAGALA